MGTIAPMKKTRPPGLAGRGNDPGMSIYRAIKWSKDSIRLISRDGSALAALFH